MSQTDARSPATGTPDAGGIAERARSNGRPPKKPPPPLVPDLEQRRLGIETWIRGIALLLVVVAVVTYPMFALIVGIEGSRLAESIAPITGIAGAIVGYWFGQASRRIQSKEDNG